MTNDELQSKTINYLRFPLILLVVIAHYNVAERGFTYHGVEYCIDRPDWFLWLTNLISEIMPKIIVPIFFIISGYLFFFRGDFNGHVYRQKLRKRVRTLLIPYILWNLIPILLHVLYLLPFAFHQTVSEEIHLTPVRLFHTFFANYPNEGIFVMPGLDTSGSSGFPYPINLPMWYVRELMVMVLLSPVVFWLIKITGKWIVILLGIIYYFYYPLVMPEGSWGVLMSQAAFFFSCGAYCGIRRINFVAALKRFTYVPLLYLIVAGIDALTKGEAYNLYILQADVLLGTVASFVIVARLIEKERVHVNHTLADSSFFVYALHTCVLFEVSKVVFIVFHLGNSVWSMLFLYFATAIFTAALCVALYMLLKRYVPFLCGLLTGGR